MASITGAELRDVVDVSLVTVYVVVSIALVSVPVGMVVVAGERAAGLLERGQSWMSKHATGLRTWGSLVLGTALVADGLVRLAI